MSFSHNDVVLAFSHKRGRLRNGNPVHRGKNMFYDSDKGTIYSFSYLQPLAKWHNGRVYALRLDDQRVSIITRKHSAMLRSNNVIWIEPVFTDDTYTQGRLGVTIYGMVIYDNRRNGYYANFPDESYFDSCLRPTPETSKTAFHKNHKVVGLGICDETGKEYTHVITSYCAYDWHVSKVGRRWQLYCDTQVFGLFKRLNDCREIISDFRKHFNRTPIQVENWLANNREHPHWDSAGTRIEAWKMWVELSF